MRRHHLWLLAAVALVLAAGALLFFWLRMPPLAARLLPEAEGYIYIDVRPVRLVTPFADLPISPDPEYQQFIQETGFQFERDLDAVAIAVHPPEPSRDGPQRRFSEVFIGRYDESKLTAYLQRLSARVEKYGDTDIFAIPHEGRTVRVALVDRHMVVASNAANEAHVRGMIDRAQRAFLPSAPDALRKHYAKVPKGSLAWAILLLTTPDGGAALLPLPGDTEFRLPRGTVTVGSVRFAGSIQLELQAFTPTPEFAAELTQSAGTFLTLFRAIETNIRPQGADPDVKRLFESIRVEQDEARVTLKAEMPLTAARKIFSAGSGDNRSKESSPR